jgi:hypothetical protein
LEILGWWQREVVKELSLSCQKLVATTTAPRESAKCLALNFQEDIDAAHLRTIGGGEIQAYPDL